MGRERGDRQLHPATRAVMGGQPNTRVSQEGTVKPRLHVFGHIHGGYGIRKEGKTTHVNACVCNEDYRPVNAPIVLDLRKPKRRQWRGPNP